MARRDAPESPWGWMFVGVLVSALGGALVSTGGEVPLFISVVVLSIGSLITLVSAIGAGVVLGIERADYLRDRD